MLQVAICFALLIMGVEVGLLISWLYYKDKIKERDRLIANLTEHNSKLEESDLCYAHDVQMLEEEVKDWKHKAAEWEAKARAFHEMAAGKDK